MTIKYEIRYTIIHDIMIVDEKLSVPLDNANRHYQEYLQDIKNGMSIVSCTDCGDGVPNDSMWQYLDNAEELLVNKYGSDQDKLTALREDRYVRAMEAKTPYESMSVAAVSYTHLTLPTNREV